MTPWRRGITVAAGIAVVFQKLPAPRGTVKIV